MATRRELGAIRRAYFEEIENAFTVLFDDLSGFNNAGTEIVIDPDRAKKRFGDAIRRARLARDIATAAL
jgi:hypothetical protein